MTRNKVAVTNNCSAMTVVFIPQVAEAIHQTNAAASDARSTVEVDELRAGGAVRACRPRVRDSLYFTFPEGCKVPTRHGRSAADLSRCRVNS